MIRKMAKTRVYLAAVLVMSSSPNVSSSVSDSEIFNELVELNNEAYESGEKSRFLKKYRPSSVSCWVGEGQQFFESRIVRGEISKKAKYEFNPTSPISIEKAEMNGVLVFSETPTHKLIISEVVEYESHCDKGTYSRASTSEYFLSITKDDYQIITPCPTDKFLKILEKKRNYRAISEDRVSGVFDSMSKTNKKSYIQDILNSEGRISTLKSIMKKHSLSLKESMLVLDRVCAK